MDVPAAISHGGINMKWTDANKSVMDTYKEKKRHAGFCEQYPDLSI